MTSHGWKPSTRNCTNVGSGWFLRATPGILIGVERCSVRSGQIWGCAGKPAGRGFRCKRSMCRKDRLRPLTLLQIGQPPWRNLGLPLLSVPLDTGIYMDEVTGLCFNCMGSGALGVTKVNVCVVALALCVQGRN